MVLRAGNLIERVICAVAATICVLESGIAHHSAYAQAAGGNVTPGAPMVTPAASTPQGTGAPGAAANATPVQSPTVDIGARRALCERWIAVLSSREKNAALLDKPEAAEFTQTVPDLVTCGAVVGDSDDLCQRLNMFPSSGGKPAPARGKPETTAGFVPLGPYRTCRETWSIFHELRAYPKGRSFLFGDVGWQHCKTFKELKASCDPLRAALRSGDASKCGSAGELQWTCRAFLSLDKSLCRAPKTGEFWQKYGEGIAKDCTDKIENGALFAKGLKAVAESGSPQERALAKAALGQAEACAAPAEAAMDVCMKGPPAAAPPVSPGSTPGPTSGR